MTEVSSLGDFTERFGPAPSASAAWVGPHPPTIEEDVRQAMASVLAQPWWVSPPDVEVGFERAFLEGWDDELGPGQVTGNLLRANLDDDAGVLGVVVLVSGVQVFVKRRDLRWLSHAKGRKC